MERKCGIERISLILFVLSLFVPVRGQSDTVAGIPVNYDESKVGEYELPDLFRLENGKEVTGREDWMKKRRPEILDAFRENQFGYAPGKPGDMHFDVFDPGTEVLDGKALRKQVCIYLTKDPEGPKIDLLIYLPRNAGKQVPLVLSINFVPNSSYIDDPGIRRGLMWNREHERVPAPESSRFGYFNFEPYIDNGIGYACFYYGDVEPDFSEGISRGIRGTYLKPGQDWPEDDGWGAIAAWAWGMSRAMDYMETDRDIQEDRVAIFGISRLGKTVLWAGASDDRYAMVIASCSGEGGAALSRRNYGETIAHLAAESRYHYQFCNNYGKYGDNVSAFPVDAHMLLAAIAPRPLLLQTGTKDYWSDPKGEFLSAIAAGPVYKMLGAEGLGSAKMPDAGVPILTTLGYFMHEGGHGTLPADYKVFIEFIRKYLVTE